MIFKANVERKLEQIERKLDEILSVLKNIRVLEKETEQ